MVKNVKYAKNDFFILAAFCVSPGDRITVLDDSNEEWWRVSSTS